MAAVLANTRKLLQLALALGAALVGLAATQGHARAESDRHMIVIPASDGYGFDDCLNGNKACGKVIADAWCEAHGMAASLSYGRADDVTASTSGPKTSIPSLEPGSIIVNCADGTKP